MREDFAAGCKGTRANRRQQPRGEDFFGGPRAALSSALVVTTENEVRPRCLEDFGLFSCYLNLTCVLISTPLRLCMTVRT